MPVKNNALMMYKQHPSHGRLLQPDLGVTDTCQFDQSLALRRGGHQQVSPVTRIKSGLVSGIT